MGSRNYQPERRNEYGDTLRYKSGHAAKTRYVGTRVNHGKVETKTFRGETDEVVREWLDWSHACDREPVEPTPMVPAHYRVKEGEAAQMAQKTTDSVRADAIELLDSGDYTQQEIASALGISQSSVSRINAERKAAEERRAQREAEREQRREERAEMLAREEAERRESMREAVPPNFLPRKSQTSADVNELQKALGQDTMFFLETHQWFAIAEEGTKVTLFHDQRTAERVLEMLQAYDPTLRVIECKTWEAV